MRTVYLAGPITGLDFAGATDWRKYAQALLFDHGVRGVSPMRAKDYLRGVEALAARGYNDKPLSSPKGIITRDRWDCTHADVVLVNLLGAKRVSIGTMMEVAWADSVRTPIVLVMEEEGNVHDHGMVREAAGFIVPTLEEGLELTVAILRQSAVDKD